MGAAEPKPLEMHHAALRLKPLQKEIIVENDGYD
jgi:hypothetical protein